MVKCLIYFCYEKNTPSFSWRLTFNKLSSSHFQSLFGYVVFANCLSCCMSAYLCFTIWQTAWCLFSNLLVNCRQFVSQQSTNRIVTVLCFTKSPIINQPTVYTGSNVVSLFEMKTFPLLTFSFGFFNLNM